MRYLLLIFLFSLTGYFAVNAQVEFSTTKHDFGTLNSYDPRYVDIELKNVGNKQEWLLSVKKPHEVIYIPSKQFIEKDSVIFVRLQVNPKTKGKFKYTVEIFTSDRSEAVEVVLTGNLKELDPNNGNNMFTACPTFNDRPAGRNPYSFDLTVITIDKETREELSNSKVTLIQSGQPVWVKNTNRNGTIKEDATLGFSYFYATHEGYYPAELGAYINFKRNQVLLELEREPTIDEPVAVVQPEPEPEPVEPIEITIEPEEHLEEELAKEVDTTFLKEIEVPESMDALANDDFSDEYFKPINVVFVLDVSASMEKGDKLELMKYSLFELADMLRPQDKMGIVTYASRAKVLLEPTSAANKDLITDQVKSLEAGGYTSGGLGIKLGFKQAKKGMIPDGVNHVIIITDGAFNQNSKDYKKAVRKYNRQGIHLSVVGIQIKTYSENAMKSAAKAGGGHYVPIHKLSDAQNNLKQEIRVLTYRY